MARGGMLLAMALLLHPALVAANMYDVIMPAYLPPPGCDSCRAWDATDGALWASSETLAAAASSCAMPAAQLTGKGKDKIKDSFSGPWCYCKATGAAGTCVAPKATPEQINLQLAEPSVLVVSFVTYDLAAPTAPPVATLERRDLAETADAAPKQIEGVSHMYFDPPNKRNYTMSFVRFSGLAPRAVYDYKVKSGSGPWSATYTFRAPYAAGATKVAIYGDMGNSVYNNMENLQSDCLNGKIDAIVHMGDHCYDLGQAGDTHGDAYMNAFQLTLASCPWLPVIGNHESFLGPGGDTSPVGTTERYLNQSWGVAYGQAHSQQQGQFDEAIDTSTTALGSFLTKGSYYGVGSHGSKPSGTSRYNSVDIGLFHIVGLDLDPGKLGTASGEWSLWNNSVGQPDAQGTWLEQDLAAADANRKNVPWIIVTSHFPLVHTMLSENRGKSARHYVGVEGEDSLEDRPYAEHHFKDCPADEPGCITVGELVKAQAEALIPIMEKHHVDVYDAGHVHSYEVSWPQLGGETTAFNYTNPTGIVYITEGNGGVPPTPAKNTIRNCTTTKGSCRMKGTGGAYGRFSATDGHTLRYEHVENPTGAVTDTWEITK